MLLIEFWVRSSPWAISFWGSLLKIAVPLTDCNLTMWAWPGAWSTAAVFYPVWVSKHIYVHTYVNTHTNTTSISLCIFQGQSRSVIKSMELGARSSRFKFQLSYLLTKNLNTIFNFLMLQFICKMRINNNSTYFRGLLRRSLVVPCEVFKIVHNRIC